MDSLADEGIRIAGRSATILRTPNVTFFVTDEITGMTSGKRRLDPMFDFEITMRFQSQSAIAAGEMVLLDGSYYLVMATEPKYLSGDLQYYKATLYKCNSVVSIYTLGSAKKPDVLSASNVRCLITQVRAQGVDEDKAVVVNRYRGRTQPFQVFAQSTSGIVRDSILVDQSARRFRVSKEFDVFVADSILQTQVIWER